MKEGDHPEVGMAMVNSLSDDQQTLLRLQELRWVSVKKNI